MSERRYAVLIAGSQFPDEPKLQPLRCPENDVDGLHEVLSSKIYGDFTDALVLKNVPHHEALLKINQVLKRAEKEDFVLIYYSGHGSLIWPAGFTSRRSTRRSTRSRPPRFRSRASATTSTYRPAARWRSCWTAASAAPWAPRSLAGISTTNCGWPREGGARTS